MAELVVLIGQRKIIRKKVTECANHSSQYLSLDNTAKVSEQGVLLEYRKRLSDLDSKIQTLKFSGEFRDEDLEAELSACQSYYDKISGIVPLLDVSVNAGSPPLSSTTDIARSLLRQPTAPLPKFQNRGTIIDRKLQEATDQILNMESQFYLNYDQKVYSDESNRLDDSLVDYTFRNLHTKGDGRIVVPLLWNGKVSHLLSRKVSLSKAVLQSN
ncbi:uncharacterized protein LOC135210107 isoform X2 [Macrobrachium nipponense]|uniref:uncharacterized protein LOC135210107 isoform X2 n=1 Tax=Macrobrachium nipponense TaxID=159736 RepID=UPI0030C82987